MKQRNVVMQKVVSVLLLVALLLTFATPVFAEGGPGPGGRIGYLPNPPAHTPQISEQTFSNAISLLSPFMRLTSDGIPYLAISREKALSLGVEETAFSNIVMSMNEVEAGILKLPKEQRPEVVFENGKYTIKSYGNLTNAAQPDSICVTVPKWALEAYAWMVIVSGGVYATIGLFVDATIIGLPAGAVLQGLGLWLGMSGTAFLWWVDTYYQPHPICLW